MHLAIWQKIVPYRLLGRPLAPKCEALCQQEHRTRVFASTHLAIVFLMLTRGKAPSAMAITLLLFNITRKAKRLLDLPMVQLAFIDSPGHHRPLGNFVSLEDSNSRLLGSIEKECNAPLASPSKLYMAWLDLVTFIAELLVLLIVRPPHKVELLNDLLASISLVEENASAKLVRCLSSIGCCQLQDMVEALLSLLKSLLQRSRMLVFHTLDDVMILLVEEFGGWILSIQPVTGIYDHEAIFAQFRIDPVQRLVGRRAFSALLWLLWHCWCRRCF